MSLPLWDEPGDTPEDDLAAASLAEAGAPARRDRIVIEADGGSRGNPGPAAGGAIVLDPATGEVLAELGVWVGTASNNVAEYRGMIEGLRAGLELAPGAAVTVRMDSKLVVEQMSGRWKIKHPDMKTLAEEARRAGAGRVVHFQWIPRAENARADALANESMDRREGFRRDHVGRGA